MLIREERIRGTLLGLAWGDVFGCPMEGWRSGSISDVFDDCTELPTEYPLEKIRPMGAKVMKKLRPFGLHSDDAQQAMGLLNIILQRSGWSLEDWGELLVKGYTEEAWRGFGRNFSAAVHKLRKGSTPEKAGSSSAGMGAAMRIAPVGGVFWNQPDLLADVAMSSSLVTHGDIRAGSLATSVAMAAGALIRGESLEQIRSTLPAELREVEKRWLEGHSEWSIDRTFGTLVSDSLEELFAFEPASLEELQHKISKLARPHLAKGFTKAHPNQGFVLLGGAHGLWMGLFGGDDPQEILTSIVQQGYDTDTVAAIAGGILGARFGTDWIPSHRFLDRDRLEMYANAMVKRTTPNETRVEFLAAEKHWTEFEKQYQKRLKKG